MGAWSYKVILMEGVRPGKLLLVMQCARTSGEWSLRAGLVTKEEIEEAIGVALFEELGACRGDPCAALCDMPRQRFTTLSPSQWDHVYEERAKKDAKPA